jgi:hypothetical protein
MSVAGERLVQQYNQPAFFSPRTGVQKVIVNQSVDSVRFQKVVHTFILLQSMFSLLFFIRKHILRKTKENMW